MRELEAMDLYDVKSLLSEEELMVQTAVARFVATVSSASAFLRS
jgi:hypothetical protein